VAKDAEKLIGLAGLHLGPLLPVVGDALADDVRYQRQQRLFRDWETEIFEDDHCHPREGGQELLRTKLSSRLRFVPASSCSVCIIYKLRHRRALDTRA